MPSLPRKALLCIGTIAFVAACSSDQPNAPMTPTSASLVRAGACNFTNIGSDARSYFASNKDPVFDLISTMSTAYKNGGAAAATDPGFDVLGRVSAALSEAGAINGTSATGNTLVTDVLACMSVGTLPASFSVQSALETNGLFAVRGGTNDPTGAVTSRSTPLYGAEAQSSSSWAASAGQRFLIYGYPIGFSFTPETPAALTAFELSTVPTPITFSPKIAAGECSTNKPDPRLQHANAILALETLSFCPAATASTTQRSGLAAAAQVVASWFTPRDLNAFSLGGGTGGLISGLSPFGPVVFTPSTATLNFVNRVPNAKVSTLTNQFDPTIQIKAQTANGTALGGVKVSLTVAGNSGSFTPPADSVEYTNDTGVATFSTFYLDKAGGYTITATGTILGQSTQTVISNLFNIKNQ